MLGIFEIETLFETADFLETILGLFEIMLCLSGCIDLDGLISGIGTRGGGVDILFMLGI